jgi:hypothetical protein
MRTVKRTWHLLTFTNSTCSLGGERSHSRSTRHRRKKLQCLLGTSLLASLMGILIVVDLTAKSAHSSPEQSPSREPNYPQLRCKHFPAAPAKESVTCTLLSPFSIIFPLGVDDESSWCSHHFLPPSFPTTDKKKKKKQGQGSNLERE